jgi:DnaK suppressor protein
MIVSLLQLMGFGLAKPVHSRAVQAPSATSAKAKDNVRVSPSRRQEVKSKTAKQSKATVAKPKAAAKPVAKVATKVIKPAAKPAKPKAAPSKAKAKPTPKPTPKAAKAAKATKPIAKPAAKPVAKKTAKPVAKTKPASKPASKPVAKVVPKVQAKPIAKPIAKPVAKKVEKLVAKVTAAKVVVKPPAKPAAKPLVKVVATPVVAKTKKIVQVMQPVVKQSAPKSVPSVVAPVAAAVPAKAGRPSSRLAQLTVPSMAQTVASTAAKASYAQAAPSVVIVPVLPSSVKKDPKLANNWKTKPVDQLSDADLQAMPDAEYMNAVQMAAFRLKLTALKRDILSNAGETTEHLREDTSVVPDPADRATIEEEHALELRTRDRERKLLKKIEQSIDRIDANDYGYCDETGEPIGVGRLLARPTATLSLEAQQRRELKQKMFGD